MPTVLLASPVRQKQPILRCFLDSIQTLNTDGLSLDALFIDDNIEPAASELLRTFRLGNRQAIIFAGDKAGQYVCNANTHFWKEGLIWKVAYYKDLALRYALEHGYDYVMLVDSDLVLHPDTLQVLVQAQKDIIAEVFWTRWQPGMAELPQVWVQDQYQLYYKERGEQLTNEQVARRTAEFLTQLRVPGVYEVGGLGACTLISRRALELGVSFAEIPNLSFWGEDRHFCIRAAALGLQLYVDTHCPAYHIYREEDLAGAPVYSAVGSLSNEQENKAGPRSQRPSESAPVTHQKGQPRITLAMLVRNEANRYLHHVIESVLGAIDNAVILDDASEDDTVSVCKSLLDSIPLTITSNDQSGFHNEVSLRKQLWQMTISQNPEWILCLDADEVLERRGANELRRLVQDSDTFYYAFRLYDMWDPLHYREDGYWQAHKTYRIFLVRYVPGFIYEWNESPQHCGRFPKNVIQLPGKASDLRIKHFGWADPISRREKYKRYLALDPEARYGIREQYESILDPHPTLIRWQE